MSGTKPRDLVVTGRSIGERTKLGAIVKRFRVLLPKRRVLMKPNDVILDALADEIAAVGHKHLSLLVQELAPKIPDVLTRRELASMYATPYACLDDNQRIRAKNLAYDIIKLISVLGRP